MIKYYECIIKRHNNLLMPSGSCEFYLVGNGIDWDSASDLLRAMRKMEEEHGGELMELQDGADLPSGVEDIRGRIFPEPKNVYAVIVFGSVQRYVAIMEVDQ